eukprot:Cvel_26459.t2-p1 / transcript=Cvel_26459.t2 / gene=Cvel_26459 / organism=Chromera_velia_CCMP2878 / gene_product=hypothetical protein / transcript_product=hypothetical protein / location=Cvel_scaffold3147:4798-5226(-) / protein_length=143 / sequence_SO=supercontig / SO=protein_coding / is_pseudo=false
MNPLYMELCAVKEQTQAAIMQHMMASGRRREAWGEVEQALKKHPFLIWERLVVPLDRTAPPGNLTLLGMRVQKPVPPRESVAALTDALSSRRDSLLWRGPTLADPQERAVALWWLLYAQLDAEQWGESVQTAETVLQHCTTGT